MKKTAKILVLLLAVVALVGVFAFASSAETEVVYEAWDVDGNCAEYTDGALTTERLKNVVEVVCYGDVTIDAEVSLVKNQSLTINLNGHTLNAAAKLVMGGKSGEVSDEGTNIIINGNVAGQPNGKINHNKGQFLQARQGVSVYINRADINLNVNSNFVYDGGSRITAFKDCTFNFNSAKAGAYIHASNTTDVTNIVFDNTKFYTTANVACNFISGITVTGGVPSRVDVYLLGNCEVDLPDGSLFYQPTTIASNLSNGEYTRWVNGTQNLYVAKGVKFADSTLPIAADKVGDTTDNVATDSNSLSNDNNYKTYYVDSIKYEVNPITYVGTTVTAGDAVELNYAFTGDADYPYTLTDNTVPVTIDGEIKYYAVGAVISAAPVYTTEYVTREDGIYYVGAGLVDRNGVALEEDITVTADGTYVFTTATVYKKAEDVAFTVEVGGVSTIYTDPTLTHEFVYSLKSETDEYTITAYTDLYLYGLDADKYNAYRVKFHNYFNGTINLNGNTLFWGDKDKTRPATVEAGNDSNAATSKETTITIKNGTVSTAGYSACTYQIRPNKNIVFTDVDFDFTTKSLGMNDGGFKSFTLNNCTVTYEGNVSTFIASKTANDVEGTREINLNGVTVVINKFTTPGAAFVSLTDTGKKDNVTVNVSGDCVFGNMYVVTVAATNKSGTNTATINFGEGMTVDRPAFWSDNNAATWTVTANYVDKEGNVSDDLIFVTTENGSVLTSASTVDALITDKDGNVLSAYIGGELSDFIASAPADSTVTLKSDMNITKRVQDFNKKDIKSVTVDLGGNTLTVSQSGQLDLGSSTALFDGMTVTVKNGTIKHECGSSVLMARPGMTLVFENIDYVGGTIGNLVDDRGCKSIDYIGGSITTQSVVISAQLSALLSDVGVEARNYNFDGVTFSGIPTIANLTGYYSASVTSYEKGLATSYDISTTNGIKENVNINFFGECDFSDAVINHTYAETLTDEEGEEYTKVWGLLKLGRRSDDVKKDGKNTVYEEIDGEQYTVPTTLYFFVGDVNVNFDVDTKFGTVNGLPKKLPTLNEYNGITNPEQIDYNVTVNFKDGDKTYNGLIVENGELTTYKTKSNLTLYSDFTYNIYLPKALGVTVAYLDGKALNVTDVLIGEEVYTKIEVSGIAPNKAAEKVVVDVVSNCYDIKVECSVLDYATSLLGGEYSVASKKLLVAALEYVAAAYTYSGVEENAALAALLAEYDEYKSEAAPKADTVTDKGETAAVIESAQLALSSDIKLILNIKADFTGTLNVQGTEYTVENGTVDGVAYVAVTLRAFELYDTVITIKAVSAEASVEGTYSLSDYIGANTDENVAALLAALNTYCFEAKAYRTSNPNLD